MPLFVGETVHGTVSFSSSPNRLDQVIDGACRDALDVSFLDNRCQRLLASAAGFEERRELGSLAQLRDVEIDPASPVRREIAVRFLFHLTPSPFAVAIPVSLAIGGAGTGSRTRARLHFQFYDPPGRKGSMSRTRSSSVLWSINSNKANLSSVIV